MYRKSPWLFAVIPFLLIAQEPQTLPQLVVTPGRSGEDPATLPVRTVTRDQRDLQLERMARTVPEAMREMPSVMIQKTGHGQGSPYLRGWTGFRTLMLVDGVRLNNSLFRDGPNQYWSTVDPLSLDRMELVLGPGSVLYGSDAIGGMVQVFTSDPLARRAGGETGRLYLRGASAERGLASRVEVLTDAGENAAAQAGITVKRHGNLRDGSGRQPNTAYDEWAVDAKVSGWGSNESRWTLAYQETEILDAPRTHRTTAAVPFRGTAAGNDQRLDFDQSRRLMYGAWEQPHTAGNLRDLRAILSWHRQAETETRIRNTGRRDENKFTVNTLGLSLQGSLGEPDSSFTVGSDIYWDRVSSAATRFAPGERTGTRQIQGPVGDDADYITAGLFAQHRRSFHEDWELVLGVRGEWAGADVGRFENPETGDPDSLSENWQTAVGSGQIIRRFDGGWQTHAGISQGFRAPNLSDLTSFGVARSGEVETPSPDLDPERFLNYELGIRRTEGTFRGELTLWYTDVSDLIGRKPTGQTRDGEPVVTKTNASDGFMQGVELTLEWLPHAAWRAWFTASWQEGRVDSFSAEDQRETEYFSRLMPLTAHLGIRHTLSERVWVEGVITHAEKADKLSAGDRRDTQRIPEGGTPGFTVAHLRTGWQLDPQTSLSVAVENLFDETYRIHGSGLNEPGRNLVVALDRRF
jgi:hemoglobin/transferrin/lactoferrin receptor protein